MVQELETVNYHQLISGRHYVYIIRSNEFVKIGHSGNLCSRLENLKSSNPIEMEIIALFIGHYKEEQMLHKVFEKHFLRNEWFRYCDEIKEFCSNFQPIPLEMARNKLAMQRSGKRNKASYYEKEMEFLNLYGTEGGT